MGSKEFLPEAISWVLILFFWKYGVFRIHEQIFFYKRDEGLLKVQELQTAG
jgi:hypothetical protein